MIGIELNLLRGGQNALRAAERSKHRRRCALPGYPTDWPIWRHPPYGSGEWM